jgi:hypothetical protein
MSCSGLHCAGCAGGSTAPVVALAAFCGLDWIVTHIVEVAVTSAACGVLAVAAVMWLMRCADRRDTRRAAERPFVIARERPGVSPTAAPSVGRPAIAPAVVFNFYGADSGDMPARVIRTAIPGEPAEAATGRNETVQDTDQPQVRHSLPSRVHRSRDRRVNDVTIQRKGHA